MSQNKKIITFKQYMAIQSRFILVVARRLETDYLTAAIIYADKMREKINSKYGVAR